MFEDPDHEDYLEDNVRDQQDLRSQEPKFQTATPEEFSPFGTINS
jgi:hypothetical protein